MKDIKKIVKKLNEINALLEENMNASNTDVVDMQQQIESMIDELEGIEEFEFEEEDED
jgi:hypothetical protein